MITNVEKIENSQVKLTVDLDKEDLMLYVKEAENTLASSLKVDGFRQGKTPPDIVRKEIGEEGIKEKALDIALKKSFLKALQKEKLDIIETVELKVLRNEPEILRYQALLFIFPELTLGEYRNIEVEGKTVEVKEEEIEKTLQYIQKSRSQFKDVDEPIKKGDKVEVDFEIKEKDKLIEGGKSENHPLIVGEGNFVPGFEDNLVGLKKGEEKTFSLTVPKDFYQKTIAGKDLNFNVKIKKVQQVLMPDLNDEFVKSLGNFDSIEALKQNVTQGITLEKEAKEKERVRLSILDKIIESSDMEAPPQLVDRQFELMLSNFDQNLHRQGLELGLYLAQVKKTKEDLRKEWHNQAVKQVKTSLILREIGKREEIQVTDEELGMVLNQTIQNLGGVQEIEKNIDMEQLGNNIRTNLLNEKIVDFLEKNSVIKKAASS